MNGEKKMTMNVGKSIFTVGKVRLSTERKRNWRLGSQKLEDNGEC